MKNKKKASKRVLVSIPDECKARLERENADLRQKIEFLECELKEAHKAFTVIHWNVQQLTNLSNQMQDKTSDGPSYCT